MTTTEHIADTLRTMRSIAGLSLTQVQQMSGVTRERLCEIERGRHTPNVTTLLRILNAYGYEMVFRETPKH